MQRRQFLGSVAVASLTGMITLPVFAGRPGTRFDWRQQVVQTVGQAPKFLPPVVTDIALAPNEQQLAVVGDDHFVSIYDIESKSFSQVLKGHTDWVRVAKYSPDGALLLTAGNDRRCLLWNPENWKSPFQLANHPAAIITAAFCPVSPQVALAGFETTLRIYDTASKELVTELTGSCNDLHCVAYSRDGQRLAAAGRDGVIRVWDTHVQRVVCDLPVHRQRIHSLQFLTDGRLLSAAEDQFLKVTNVDSKQVDIEFPRFASKLYCAVVWDQARVVTGGSDNQVTLWDLATRDKLATLSGHTGTVSCLASGPTRIVSGSYDTQVRIWSQESNTSAAASNTPSSDGWNSRLK